MPKRRNKGKPRFTAQPAKESDLALKVCVITLKVCRLCESKDGPFLNIFESEKLTAKKIEELLPFGVAENDELPHKICFRCSAKVEELHEFIQKCIKTQINLRTALGKKEPFVPKLKTHKSLWEEKLNKSNVSNDDICDAVIKKAMEGIKEIPINPLPLDGSKDTVESDLKTYIPGDENVINKSEISKLIESSKDIINIDSDENAGEESKIFEIPTKCTRKNSKPRTLRSNIESVSNVTIPQLLTKLRPTAKRGASVATLGITNETNNKQLPTQPRTTTGRRSDAKTPSYNKKMKIAEAVKDELGSNNTPKKSIENSEEHDNKGKQQFSETKNISTTQNDQKNSDQSTADVNAKKTVNEEPFNIMDHVNMIKVNGVGVLFQCKLCNRNFLKIDVVQSHSCAKNRVVPKEDILRKPNPPEPPKPPTVKYINTKLGNNTKNFAIQETSNFSDKTDLDLKTPSVIEGNPMMKPKPRIGPASKVKRDTEEYVTSVIGTKNSTVEKPSGKKQNVTCGGINIPPAPNLNCPYKLVPGPNNTFTLVEEPVTQEHDLKIQKNAKNSQEPQNVAEVKSKQRQSGNHSNYAIARNSNNLLLDSGNTEATKQSLQKQPYPVGIFQTVPKLSCKTPQTTTSMLFSATAAQKQSYSIVQTGHPSKLLISAKPQQRAEEPVKKGRKIKYTQKCERSSQPFSVTLDDTSRSLDPDTFSVLNIDPLLSPSYVLPITNESQPVTSNNGRHDAKSNLLAGNNGHYTCNMCNEVFTREQKLLAHIHSHYKEMDEQDDMRVSESTRKRGRHS